MEEAKRNGKIILTLLIIFCIRAYQLKNMPYTQNEMSEVVKAIIQNQYDELQRPPGSVKLCTEGLYGYVPTYPRIKFNLRTPQELQEEADETGESVYFSRIYYDFISRNFLTGRIGSVQYSFRYSSKEPNARGWGGSGTVWHMRRTAEGWKFVVVGTMFTS